MLDSVLKSLNIRYERFNVHKEPSTFTQHQENLRKHIFVKFKARRLDSFSMTDTVPNRELTGHKKSLESGIGMIRIWILGQSPASGGTLYKLLKPAEIPVVLLQKETGSKIHLPEVLWRRTSHMKLLQLMQHPTPGKWGIHNKGGLSSTSLPCGTLMWHVRDFVMGVEQWCSWKHGVFKSNFKNSEGNSDICYNTDEAWRHTKQISQPHTEGQML